MKEIKSGIDNSCTLDSSLFDISKYLNWYQLFDGEGIDPSLAEGLFAGQIVVLLHGRAPATIYCHHRPGQHAFRSHSRRQMTPQLMQIYAGARTQAMNAADQNYAAIDAC